MNAGLIAKTIRDVWVASLLFSVGIGLAEGFIARILPTFFEQMSEQFLSLPFFQNFLRAFLGPDAAGAIGPDVITAMAWTHPVVLVLVVTPPILFCSRVPAGEVDNGTADLLLGLPVSRWSIYAAETVVWVSAGALLIGMGLAGNVLGAMSVESDAPLKLAARVMAAGNLYCLYIAVGGIAWLFSALGNRRGRVCGVVFGIVVASFLMNFLAPFNEIVNAISVLGLLAYHRPHEIIRSGTWPIGDMVVLVSIGAVTWLLGGIVFARRDIATT